MRHLGFIALLGSYFYLIAIAGSPSSSGLSTSGTITSTSADPSATIFKLRRTHNCNQDERLRKIEAQAWADAGAMAQIAAQYDNGNQWQPVIHYRMGIDSIKSENFNKI
jgi:hypothetical protein